MNIYRIFYRIKELPKSVKHFYQRANRGYSYRDVWSIHDWFTEIMPKMLTDLKKNLHGCPAQFTHNEDGTEFQDVEKGVKDWENVIERMIFCFREMNEETCSMKNEYEEEYYRQFCRPDVKDQFVPYGEDKNGNKLYRLITGEVEPELKENYRKKVLEIDDYRAKMKNEGFELFSKYFWNLWD